MNNFNKKDLATALIVIKDKQVAKSKILETVDDASLVLKIMEGHKFTCNRNQQECICNRIANESEKDNLVLFLQPEHVKRIIRRTKDIIKSVEDYGSAVVVQV